MEEKQTKNERREQAREKARLAREEAAKKQRNKKIAIQASAITAVFIAAAMIVLVVLGLNSSKAMAMNPANTSGYGYLYTQTGGLNPAAATSSDSGVQNVTPDEGKDTISVYLDFACPHCANFEATNGQYLDTLMKSGDYQVYYYPVAFLTKYSTNAANAAACVADVAPDNAWNFVPAMFQKYLESGQPESQYNPSKSDIADTAKEVAGNIGDDNTKRLQDCITNGNYEKWVKAGTESAFEGPLPNTDQVQKATGTPTIIVNGAQYTGSLTDPTAFKDFVVANSKSAGDANVGSSQQ